MDKKILILLPIFGREKITKICFDNIKLLQRDYKIDVLCIVSEGWAENLAVDYNFKFVYADNEWLGIKMNRGIKEAMTLDFDYLMNYGSDDIITSELLKIYEPYFDKNTPIFGSTCLTFVDSVEKRAKTYDYKFLIGCGRCIRKDVLAEVLKYKNIYDKISIGLDMNSLAKFYQYEQIEIKNPFNTIIDIKGVENIWKYKELNGQEIDFNKSIAGLKLEQINAIKEL